MLAGPNPAHSAVSLAAALPRAASVDVAVYSTQGGLVRRLLTGASLPAGTHPLVWDGHDESGARAPRGVYFARMRADGIVSGHTTIVLR
jgi:flagellar hook assembly protein FlgD